MSALIMKRSSSSLISTAGVQPLVTVEITNLGQQAVHTTVSELVPSTVQVLDVSDGGQRTVAGGGQTRIEWEVDLPAASPPSSGQGATQYGYVERHYRIQRTEDLTTGFTNLAAGIEATPPENSVTDAVESVETRFYRIRLEE